LFCRAAIYVDWKTPPEGGTQNAGIFVGETRNSPFYGHFGVYKLGEMWLQCSRLPEKNMPSTWLIHDKDGGLLGESKALSAKVAFVLYMSDKGRAVNLADVKTETLPDGRVSVVLGRKVFFLKKGDR
jgi:hypothetical protein